MKKVIKDIIIKGLFLIVMLCLFYSCAYSSHRSLIFINNKNADMPVWIKGNTESKTFIIYFHGGPSGNCFLFSCFPAFKMLEEDFAVVYWAQRGSSVSLGNLSESTFNMQQYVEDADKVIDYIQYQYNPDSIFIMAHSWGGRIAKDYLIEQNRQNKISGYIEIDGSNNIGNAQERSRQWMIDYAHSIIENPDTSEENVIYWNDALEWYEQNPVITLENRQIHYSYIYQISGLYVRPQKVFGTIMLNIFHMIAFSPYHPLIAKQNRELISIVHKNVWEDYNISLDVSKIVLPVLICWGEFDVIINLELGISLFEKLGTPLENKFLAIFNNSGHAPHWEEPQKFYDTVKEFVLTYN